MAEEGSSQPSAHGVPISGRFFTDFYLPTQGIATSDFQQISGSLWLQAEPKLGEGASANLIFTADEIAASSVQSPQFRPGLREAYITYIKSGFEARAGKMIIPWGKSDAINPTDFLTATDYTFFNPDYEVRRLGAITLQLSWTPQDGESPWTVTGVFIPVSANSRILIPQANIPTGLTLATTPQVPPTTLNNAETALKVSYAGNYWDASVLVFSGWNSLPDYQITGITGTAPAVSVTAAQNFHRYRALGADGSLTSGRWIFRAETAYVWTENNDGANPLIQPTHWDTVVGVERPLWGDFRGQVQLVTRYFPRYQPPTSITDPNPTAAAIKQQVAGFNALIQNYQDAFRPGGTLRFSYKNEQSGLEGELFLMGNFVGGDYLFRPQVAYSWTDSFKSTVGLDYYGGPSDRPLGALSPYNAVYTEAKVSF